MIVKVLYIQTQALLNHFLTQSLMSSFSTQSCTVLYFQKKIRHHWCCFLQSSLQLFGISLLLISTLEMLGFFGLGRSPGEEKGYPFQDSGLENSMDCIDHGVAKRHNWVTLTSLGNAAKNVQFPHPALSSQLFTS